jgi:hypothetical protein
MAKHDLCAVRRNTEGEWAEAMARKMKPEDEMRRHYDFSGGVRGKHAARYAGGTNVVVDRHNDLGAPHQDLSDRRVVEISRSTSVLQTRDLWKNAMAINEKQDLIEAAGFTYWADRDAYINTKAKKIVWREDVNDLSEERLTKFIAAPNDLLPYVACVGVTCGG